MKLSGLGKMVTYGKNLLKGTKYGGIQVGKKLTLVPTNRLTKFVNNAEQYGSPFDTAKNITPEKAREFIRRLGPAGKTKSVKNIGDNLKYFKGHGWTQIWDFSNNKPVVNIVERLKNPTTELIKNKVRNIFS